MRGVSRGLITAVMVAASACTNAPAVPHPGVGTAPSVSGTEQQARVPGEYLVMLAAGARDDVISERFGRFGIKDVNELGDETFLLVLSNDPGPHEMEALSRGDARIISIQPNLIYWTNRSGKITR